MIANDQLFNSVPVLLHVTTMSVYGPIPLQLAPVFSLIAIHTQHGYTGAHLVLYDRLRMIYDHQYTAAGPLVNT